MGESGSQSWPFVIVLALVLAGIAFMGVLLITVLVLATVYSGTA
jgi:hypothetical protein